MQQLPLSLSFSLSRPLSLILQQRLQQPLVATVHTRPPIKVLTVLCFCLLFCVNRFLHRKETGTGGERQDVRQNEFTVDA